MALKGIKVIEFLGLAPGPFCGKILADFGASVTVVQKIDAAALDVLSNGKRIIPINLKSKEGICIVKQMCSKVDIIIDPFRPGVLEKLGLDPKILTKENKRLICARLTGYGQTGVYKYKAGHDINYVAMSGLLSLLGKPRQSPLPPLNLLADFGGGSLICVLGILMALIERNNSGIGQIIDVSMTEGASYMGSWIYKSQELPIWMGEPGTNILDGGVPFYNTYKTKDDKYMAVGALEPQFYTQFLLGLGLDETDHPQMIDMEKNKNKFKEVFLTKEQKEWTHIFEHLDACVTPVLELTQVNENDHNVSRNSFDVDEFGKSVPTPAPKLSRTPAVSSEYKQKHMPGEDSVNILLEAGFSKKDIKHFRDKGIVLSSTQSCL